jgi:hypothetical protein
MMKRQRKILSILFFSGFCFAIVQGQETIPATGGDAGGSGGSVSYTVGQTFFSSNSGANGTEIQGVQQPYEISVVTAVDILEEISLHCSVYPNPTRGLTKLVFESPDYENLRFRLYDISGVLLLDKKVESSETGISLENLSSSVYFLKVYRNSIVVKVFKIVKNK